MDHLILGTRGSALALWQAQHVREVLEHHGAEVETRVITTTGDRRLDVPLASIGEKGLFTQELDSALLNGEIHLAVHSLKDLPSELPPGIALAAVTRRSSARDAFVAGPGFELDLMALPDRAIIGTSSVRRQSQLKAWRPDLQIVAVRGNVDTRLRKLDESAWHGIVLAEAGLARLGLSRRVRDLIPLDIMLPAVGQGALGVVCAAENSEIHALLRDSLHHEGTALSTAAERSFLRRLEGGCSVPVAAHAVVDDEHLSLSGAVAALDGSVVYRSEASGPSNDAEALGTRLAEHLLEKGADQILDNIRGSRA